MNKLNLFKFNHSVRDKKNEQQLVGQSSIKYQIDEDKVIKESRDEEDLNEVMSSTTLCITGKLPLDKISGIMRTLNQQQCNKLIEFLNIKLPLLKQNNQNKQFPVEQKEKIKVIFAMLFLKLNNINDCFLPSKELQQIISREFNVQGFNKWIAQQNLSPHLSQELNPPLKLTYNHSKSQVIFDLITNKTKLYEPVTSFSTKPNSITNMLHLPDFDTNEHDYLIAHYQRLKQTLTDNLQYTMQKSRQDLGNIEKVIASIESVSTNVKLLKSTPKIQAKIEPPQIMEIISERFKYLIPQHDLEILKLNTLNGRKYLQDLNKTTVPALNAIAHSLNLILNNLQIFEQELEQIISTNDSKKLLKDIHNIHKEVAAICGTIKSIMIDFKKSTKNLTQAFSDVDNITLSIQQQQEKYDIQSDSVYQRLQLKLLDCQHSPPNSQKEQDENNLLILACRSLIYDKPERDIILQKLNIDTTAFNTLTQEQRRELAKLAQTTQVIDPKNQFSHIKILQNPAEVNRSIIGTGWLLPTNQTRSPNCWFISLLIGIEHARNEKGELSGLHHLKTLATSTINMSSQNKNIQIKLGVPQLLQSNPDIHTRVTEILNKYFTIKFTQNEIELTLDAVQAMNAMNSQSFSLDTNRDNKGLVALEHSTFLLNLAIEQAMNEKKSPPGQVPLPQGLAKPVTEYSIDTVNRNTMYELLKLKYSRINNVGTATFQKAANESKGEIFSLSMDTLGILDLNNGHGRHVWSCQLSKDKPNSCKLINPWDSAKFVSVNSIILAFNNGCTAKNIVPSQKTQQLIADIENDIRTGKLDPNDIPFKLLEEIDNTLHRQKMSLNIFTLP